MTIIHLIVILVLIGLGLWAVNTVIPMEPPVKKILNVIVVVLVVLLLLEAFGFIGPYGLSDGCNARVPQVGHGK